MEEARLERLPKPGVYSLDSLRMNEIISALSEIYTDGRSGAVALYLGVARSESIYGKKVKHLEIEAYEENANLEIEKICREVREKHSIIYVGIWHLKGLFNPGEPIVLVAAAGGHREPVFRALREAVERYKREPALFKKEVYLDGTHSWITE